jgi:hypothetical protein
VAAGVAGQLAAVAAEQVGFFQVPQFPLLPALATQLLLALVALLDHTMLAVEQPQV